MNSRPLTVVSTAAADDVPLTPAMLLGEVCGEYSTEPLSAAQISARVRHIAMVREHVSKRWKEEYLVKLSSYALSISIPVQEGDVVLLVDDTKKRHFWKLARVVKLYTSRDGKQRVGRIQVGGSSATLLRPIQRLIPLEVTDAAPYVPSEVPVDVPVVGGVDVPVVGGVDVPVVGGVDVPVVGGVDVPVVGGVDVPVVGGVDAPVVPVVQVVPSENVLSRRPQRQVRRPSRFDL